MNLHQPVLLKEAIEALRIKPAGIYVDGTFGRGGHSKSILQRLNEEGRLFAIDKDSAAIAVGQEAPFNDSRFSIKQGSFASLAQFAKEWGIAGKVDGILLDFGVSSPQLDIAERGFSFLNDGPLDMRMDQTQTLTARELLETASEKDLVTILKEYGEERFAKRIAQAIILERQTKPIMTTKALAALVEKAIPKRELGKHPATRTFQALRIAVNQELEDIENALPQALEILKVGGLLAVISFHSLEDRIVKRFMRDQSKGDNFPRDLPIQHHVIQPKMAIIGKAIKPSLKEVEENTRSRSAILRIAEKLS